MGTKAEIIVIIQPFHRIAAKQNSGSIYKLKLHLRSRTMKKIIILIRDISYTLTKYLFEATGGGGEEEEERATSSNKYRNTCGRQRRKRKKTSKKKVA
jgi:hypothetical protein